MRSLALTLGTLLALGCGGPDTAGPVAPTVASILVTPAIDTIEPLGTLQLTAAARDAAGSAVPGVPIAWTSSDSGVASVSSAGLVTGHAEGAATLRASAQGAVGSAAVTVRIRVTAVVIAPDSSAVPYRASVQLIATPRDRDGAVVPGRSVAWATSDPLVAVVDWSGRVSGVAPGEARIIATSEGTADTALIRVAPLTIRVLATGTHGACVLTTDSLTYCWGSNYRGELGLGTWDGLGFPNPWPTPIAGGPALAMLDGGGMFFCGLTAAGSAYCWGSNTWGQLGAPSTETCTPDNDPCSRRPTAVAGGLAFTALTAGSDHACGIAVGGLAYCWGANHRGQLGTGDTLSRSAPAPVAGGMSFSAISAGDDHTCGITTAGVAHCWGSNVFGQLGNGDTTTFSFAAHPIPEPVAGGFVFTTLSAGYTRTCALAAGGAAHCWGHGGPSGVQFQSVPVAVPGGLVFASLRAGWHSCGITAGGTGYCWGFNTRGELGTGDSTSAVTPAAVAGGLLLAAVQVGAAFSCGLTATGIGYCWGWNDAGRLGDGTTLDRLVPTRVAGQQ